MPEGYKVRLIAATKSELESLHNPTLKRIVMALSALSENPRPRGCKKLVGSSTKYRLRVGDYRIIYEIEDSEQTVMVYRIRHRKEVYD